MSLCMKIILEITGRHLTGNNCAARSGFRSMTQKKRFLLEILRLTLFVVLFYAVLMPKSVFSQTCEVPGTYEFNIINQQLNIAFTSILSGNCATADRAMENADVAIVQILTECTLRQCIKDMSDYQRLFAPARALRALDTLLEQQCGYRRTYENTIVTVESWNTTPVCSATNPGVNPKDPRISFSWSGTWNTNWGKMVLKDSGNRVTGTYEHDKGKIEGTIFGNVLKGTWSEAPSYSPPNDGGDIEFTLSDDGKSWTGKWRYGSSGGWSGDWTGTR